jgi:hypothetical protein
VGVVVEPGVIIDHAIIGKEWRIANVFEGVAALAGRKLLMGVFYSIDRDEFGILFEGEITELYLIHVHSLSTETW